MLVYLLTYYECEMPYDSVVAVFSSKEKLLLSIQSNKVEKFWYDDDGGLSFIINEVELDDMRRSTLDNPLSYNYYHKLLFNDEELFIPFSREIIGCIDNPEVLITIDGDNPTVSITIDGSIYTVNYNNTTRQLKKSTINPIILEEI